MKTIKRKPKISIVITADNNISALKNCLNSFYKISEFLRSVEFVIVNNFKNDSNSQQVKKIVGDYSNLNIIFYQSQFAYNCSQLKNIAINFSNGFWLFFMDSFETPTPIFLNFLVKFKFDIRNDFYRLTLKSEKGEKQKIGIINTRYYSNLASTIIFNKEFLEKYNIRWETNIMCHETVLMLNKIYSIKNVNFVYLKNIYSVFHNFYLDRTNINLFNFYNLERILTLLEKEKLRNYKQFIIMETRYFLLNQTKVNKNQVHIEQIREIFKKSKINFFSYLFFPPKLAIKMIFFKFKFNL